MSIQPGSDRNREVASSPVSAPSHAASESSHEVSPHPKYPGIPCTSNGNQLVSTYTEARLADAGVFFPITPSTEMGESFQLSFAKGELNVFGRAKIAIETEGEHAAQGGAIAYSVTGKRVVNFTSGQGVVYALEQYYHAPGKLSTMVVEVAARPFTKHALNVHCGHDDVYCAMDTGWIITFAVDAQQAADQALIIRRVTELALTPGMNAMDGFLTSHVERSFLRPEAGLIREFLGRPDDMIPCPTQAQREMFGPNRRRVPECVDLRNPCLLGSVQNQEHYMGGVAARRHHFVEPILGFFQEAYDEFERLTGRSYGLVSEYNNDGAETCFVCLGSAAENCQAAVDYLERTRGTRVGVVHVNVLRPFPEAAVLQALEGKRRIIVLERMDDQTAGDGPLARDVRTVLSKAIENYASRAHDGLGSLAPSQMPQVFSGVYGLGSRDFRPEGIIGAFEFATGERPRQDGRTAAEGTRFFYVGINHPYNVTSDDAPSLLPDGAIAIRFHSIGGWGMITTGKNLGSILAEIGSFISKRDFGDANHETLHVSANPKYGSEKKGAPTNYFLVVAPERVRVNCDLHHVDVVLCCDPKIFTHTNPLVGLRDGGAFVWESAEADDNRVWERIPEKHRQEIIDRNIRIFVLNGFAIARESTSRSDLEYRMQGNSFLGAFFRVSSVLRDHEIPDETFLEVVEAQYRHKFGHLGDAVVESNMKVMKAGFNRVRQVQRGSVDAPDRSSMRGQKIVPLHVRSKGAHWSVNTQPVPVGAGSNGSGGTIVVNGGSGHGVRNEDRPPLMDRDKYDAEFRSGWGYDQPSTPHASTGVIAAATGSTTSKYVARRQTPLFIPENCTQCMACITACPDTAMPNTAQDIASVLRTAAYEYVTDADVRDAIVGLVPHIDTNARARMTEIANTKGAEAPPFHEVIEASITPLLTEHAFLSTDQGRKGVAEWIGILEKVPMAYSKVHAIFRNLEKKDDGAGGLFSIFINDLCKGCAECVHECGDHHALVMVDETEDVNGLHETGIAFLDRLADTPSRFLGKYDPTNPQESKAAVLQNHLMQRSKYEALVSGDGACAGCGEKTILHSVASITEAVMRPLFHAKSDRLEDLAQSLATEGVEHLSELKATQPESYRWIRQAILHIIMGFGGENLDDTNHRIETEFLGTDADILDALRLTLRQDAHNHRDLQAVDGGPFHGMSVMAMMANTGCNTVYGSTHPNNPHPYPWMNSLFQDGPTIGWLVAESFIVNHARRSVIPERIARALLSGSGLDESDYWTYTHFNDSLMTPREVLEMPRVWVVGGDGGLGDIGYQNLSKAVLQNRPNVQIVMLDTQVYSNTGGQNSDSSPMPGGFDMNQLGAASEGKLTEKKGVAETLLEGHGSPYVAQVSMANVSALYSSIIDAMMYRGTGFIQAYTTCQPEHGVGDDMASTQARLVRDSRGMPEFVFDPTKGESFDQCLSVRANPSHTTDWWRKPAKDGTKYDYTVAHWAYTEARFRRHFFNMSPEQIGDMERLEDVLLRVSQQDIVYRNYLNPEHRAFIPKEGVYTLMESTDGTMVPVGMSRQVAAFCVERRKAWRMLQSKAGITNVDRLAHEKVLRAVDAREIDAAEFRADPAGFIDAARAEVKAGS